MWYLFLATLIGFMLAVCPYLVGSVTKSLQNDNSNWGYQQAQFLFHSANRTRYHQGDSSDPWHKIILANAMNGLTAFNRPSSDRSGQYIDRGKYGFVDYLTGIFLWIGALVALLRVRRGSLSQTLVLAHFLIFLFIFMFIINQAPYYPRLLIMLPFVVALAVIGVSMVSRWATFFLPNLSDSVMQSLSRVMFGGLGLLIIGLNVFILKDYILNISQHPYDPTSSVIRYINAVKRRATDSLFV